MGTEAKVGRIEAVCMSPRHGYPTYPQEKVVVSTLGIEGDAHSGPLRESFQNPGTLKPNDRPISIVADEVRQEMNETLGLNMQHGDFNEQIVVSGLGDLGDVATGDQIHFDNGVQLEIVENAMPCDKLEAYNKGPGLIKALAFKRDGEIYSKRGILTRVVQTGELQPGVAVTIKRANPQ